MFDIKQFILDLKSKGADRIELVTKNSSDKIVNVEKRFSPYFYFQGDNKIKKALEKNEQIKNVEEVEKFVGLKKEKVLKLSAYNPEEVPDLKRDLQHFGNVWEYDIPYRFRFLVDNDLYCSRMYDDEFKESYDEKLKLKMRGFDIEVYAPEGGMPDPRKDEVVIASYVAEDIDKSFTAEKSEKDLLEKFVNEIKNDDPDVLMGYNSAGFDFPYLKKRYEKNKIDFNIGRDNSQIKLSKTLTSAKAYIYGRVHLDAFKGVDFLSLLGILNLTRKKLGTVYKEYLGKEKLGIDKDNMSEYWSDLSKRKTFIEYNRQDSLAAYEIGKSILPLFIELSKLTGLPIYDVSNMTSGQMIEWLLIREGFKRNQIVPNRPTDREIEQRMIPVQGAFVKKPKEGLHENIAVCDFRSLYPSIIITHNLSPETYNCECCQNDEKNPAGHIFCKKQRGTIPIMLEKLITGRKEVKQKMKKVDKNTFEYKMLNAKQQAMKLLANSTYGYLLFTRSRWYSREAGESATAFGRMYIQNTIQKAEAAGFEVIYADTDSTLLLLNKKTKEDVIKFVEKINSELPGTMELEFQKFCPRGIFVTKREGSEAAKKRYALLNEDGTIDIKGFEFVRGDWSNIAKVTQEKVISAVLKEGDPEKAVGILKDAINKLKKGDVLLKDLVIYKQITRNLDEYQQQGPHVKAAKLLAKAGEKITPGYILGYVVTEGSGSISDRSVPVDLLKKEKIDYNYYISHQILPAALKILKELGVKEEDLKYTGVQNSLAKWS